MSKFSFVLLGSDASTIEIHISSELPHLDDIEADDESTENIEKQKLVK